MKKLVLLLIATSFALGMNAQNNKRTSAYNYLKNGKLDKAKEYIEPTIEHHKTMNVAKTWFYRGNIYLQIALTTNEEYKDLDSNALEVAYESYLKCKELDEKGTYTEDINTNMIIIASNFFNKGVKKYNEADYEAAASAFQSTYDVTLGMGRTDTLALQNVALAYEIGGQYDKAIESYKKLIEIGAGDALVYNALATIYLKLEDEATAEEYIKKGRELYPEDYQLLIAETNLYLSRGENEKAIDNLEVALEKDPTNKTIWFALGTNYENTGQSDKAEEAYQKCIELDPEYADAYYNMGAMYNNRAAEIIEKANELPLDAVEEYNAEKAKAEELLKKAVPFLEKSDELNPDVLPTLQTLKQIYTMQKDMEKLKAVNARIDSLTQ